MDVLLEAFEVMTMHLLTLSRVNACKGIVMRD